jgi:hypothetical protein
MYKCDIKISYKYPPSSEVLILHLPFMKRKNIPGNAKRMIEQELKLEKYNILQDGSTK